MPWWRSLRRSWPGRWPGPMTPRCTRSSCTSAPTSSPRLPRLRPRPRTRPAQLRTRPARCHVEDGPAVSVSTAQMLGCTAALSWMRHDPDGAVLALGRRRRRPTAALRRAARERDKCRCRFPGCESRRVDLHHIVHWCHGGRTDLENIISLCPYHHKLVHERGYLIAAPPDGSFTFCRPDGTALPHSPPLPSPEGAIDQIHDADITPETIIPPDRRGRSWSRCRYQPHCHSPLSGCAKAGPAERTLAIRGCQETQNSLPSGSVIVTQPCGPCCPRCRKVAPRADSRATSALTFSGPTLTSR